MVNKLFTTPYSAKKGAVAAARKAGMEDPIETFQGEGGKWFVKDTSRFASVDPVKLDTGRKVSDTNPILAEQVAASSYSMPGKRVLEPVKPSHGVKGGDFLAAVGSALRGNMAPLEQIVEKVEAANTPRADEFEMSEEELAAQAGRKVVDLSEEAWAADLERVKAGVTEVEMVELEDKWGARASYFASVPRVATPGFVPAGTALAEHADKAAASLEPKTRPVVLPQRVDPATPAVPGATKKGMVADMLRAGGATIPQIAAKLEIGEQAARSLIGDLRNDGLLVRSARVQGSRHVLYTL